MSYHSKERRQSAPDKLLNSNTGAAYEGESF